MHEFLPEETGNAGMQTFFSAVGFLHPDRRSRRWIRVFRLVGINGTPGKGVSRYISAEKSQGGPGYVGICLCQSQEFAQIYPRADTLCHVSRRLRRVATCPAVHQAPPLPAAATPPPSLGRRAEIDSCVISCRPRGGPVRIVRPKSGHVIVRTSVTSVTYVTRGKGYLGIV